MSSNETQKQLNEIITYYQNQKDASSQESLVSLLREVQELLDHIPPHVQETISNALCIKPTIITRLIKLYPSLTTSPSRHQIVLCFGPSCSAKDSQKLYTAIKKSIRNKPFHLTTQNCLKQCPTAPNIRIGNKLYPSVQAEDIDKLIAEYDTSALPPTK